MRRPRQAPILSLRRGRNWSTETGNLAATLLTTTDVPPAEAAQLSFVAALAAAPA
jgi:BirA family biotin operon repressor/biotin-[acetyl-CoA-carboxylase] ligase